MADHAYVVFMQIESALAYGTCAGKKDVQYGAEKFAWIHVGTILYIPERTPKLHIRMIKKRKIIIKKRKMW